MTGSLKIADYGTPPLCLRIKAIVAHQILPFPMPCASSFFIAALAMILKYPAKQGVMEEVCLSCSLRQVVLGIAEASTGRKGVVAACDAYAYPVLVCLIVTDNA